MPLRSRHPLSLSPLRHRLSLQASDASGTGLFDPATRAWDPQRIAQLDPERLAGCLPELIGANEAVGTLRPEVARELGLPADVQVAPGGGDNAMAALGAGAVREGIWVLSLGTSGAQSLFGWGHVGMIWMAAASLGCHARRSNARIRHPSGSVGCHRCRQASFRSLWLPLTLSTPAGTLFGPSAKPVLDPSGTICPFADAAGAWLPLLCTLNCTGVTEEVRLYGAACLPGCLLARGQPACRSCFRQAPHAALRRAAPIPSPHSSCGSPTRCSTMTSPTCPTTHPLTYKRTHPPTPHRYGSPTR